MSESKEAILLRIFLGEGDGWEGKPLYQAIVDFLLKANIAGATVLRGIEGFGASKDVHTARILRASEDLPLVVEVVDTEDRIEAVIPELRRMASGALITIERVRVL